MTNTELRDALVSGAAVVCEPPGEIPIEYARVSGITYKRESDLYARERRPGMEQIAPGIVVLAILRDRAANSETVCDPAWVRYK